MFIKQACHEINITIEEMNDFLVIPISESQYTYFDFIEEAFCHLNKFTLLLTLDFSPQLNRM